MIILCDMDMTLSNSLPRQHYIMTKPKEWGKFFKETSNDKPIEEVRNLVNSLKHDGNTIFIVTGRPESTREKSIDWLNKYDIEYDRFYCRGGSDFKKSYLVKKEILKYIKNEFPNQRILVLDDQDDCKDMYISEGVVVLQVRLPEAYK